MIELQGWVIIWVEIHSDFPRITSNVADGVVAVRMADLMLAEGRAAEILCVCPAAQLRRVGSWYNRGNCLLPPPGWRCTRGAGHDGPCAARPV